MVERKKYFSERAGHKTPPVTIQHEAMDSRLRVALWNVAYQTIYSDVANDVLIELSSSPGQFLGRLWADYFRRALDEYPEFSQEWRTTLKDFFMDREWHEVYDILEFSVDLHPDRYSVENFYIPAINAALEQELSAYRFVGHTLTPITSPAELVEIQEAIAQTGPLSPVQVQLEEALRKLSDRKAPDYRGSIKESISAVETIFRLVVGDDSLELGKALKALESKAKFSIHPAVRNAFIKLYGWTSDDQGIRHALMDDPNLRFEDAKFMLVACSALINLVLAKLSEAGLSLP